MVGALYHRFPNERLLYQTLLDEPTRQFQVEVLVSLGNTERGPLEKLKGFLSWLAFFTEENLELLYGGHDTLRGAERVEHYYHPAYGWARWTVLGLLREATRKEELEPKLDVEYLADALLTPLNLELYYYQRRVMGIPPERISTGLSSLVPGDRWQFLTLD